MPYSCFMLYSCHRHCGCYRVFVAACCTVASCCTIALCCTVAVATEYATEYMLQHTIQLLYVVQFLPPLWMPQSIHCSIPYSYFMLYSCRCHCGWTPQKHMLQHAAWLLRCFVQFFGSHKLELGSFLAIWIPY